MARLNLWLFGPFRAELSGQITSGFSSVKVRALLAYIAMSGDRPAGREFLADLLWPEEARDVGQTNLRQALANLRQVLGERASSEPILDITRETVALARTSDCFVDAREFDRLVDHCRTHNHRRLHACDECTARLEAARALYRGDFLAGLFVVESPEYEEWQRLQRERLREDYFQVLSALADHYFLAGDPERARVAAAQQLATDPWREEAHRQLMRAHAAAGNRSAALAQYEACRRALAAEFGAEPSEETRELFAQVRAERFVAEVGGRAHNWPGRVTSFVGRKRELAELARLLQARSPRLVTLTGLDGVGKSRLMIEAGRRLAYVFTSGAWYVQLSGAAGRSGASYAIASAMERRLSNPVDPLAELARSLGECEVLLVLDNCSRELEHAAAVSSLLAACPNLTILASGNESLGVSGERVLQLDGLGCAERAPDCGDGSADAEELFVDRMRAAGFDGELTAADREAITGISKKLGGLPLAIELAAAWTPVLSCREIAAELDRGLRFLDVQQGDASQRKLSAVLERAWLLLPERERYVFEQLAVFADGFRRAEAQVVVDAGAPGGDGVHPLDAALRLLTGRSLLRLSAPGRYRQHPLVLGVAKDRLAQRPELKAVAEARHASAYLGLLARAETSLKGPGQQLAVAELSAEARNIEVAWRWALEAGSFDLIAAAAGPLATYLDLLSRPRQASELLEAAEMAAVRQAGHISGRQAILLLRAELLAHAGMQRYRLHELPEARSMLQQSLALLPPEEGRVRAIALHGLGNTLFWEGDAEGAERCYEEALGLANREQEQWRAACLWYLLGDCASVRGDHGAAMLRYDEALSVFRAFGDPRMIAIALSNLGDGYRRQALLDEARSMYLESLALSESIGHRRLIANNENGLGEVAYAAGDYRVAEEHYGASQKVCREIGAQSLLNLNLIGLAHVACRRGDPRTARVHLREAICSLSEHAAWAVLPAAITCLAHILSLGDREDQRKALSLLAQVLCHPQTWEDYRQRAMSLFVDLQARLPEDLVDMAVSNPEPVRLLVAQVVAFELPPEAPGLGETGCLNWMS